MSQLITDWLRIATEGNTFQNVPIERQWVIDIAETYNSKTYGARIWPEHRRWYGAWGDVEQVKAEEIDGKMCLFAKIKPNSQLITANENDQKVYTSIELDPNFAGSGKAYLTGLGVTDEPASLGTDRLKFSTKERFETHKYGAPEQLVMNYPIINENNETATEAHRLFSKLVNLFSMQSPEQAPAPQEEPPMDQQQFDALMGKFETFGTKLTELESKVETFGKKPEEPAPAAKDETEANKDETTVPGVSAEQFSKVETLLTGLTEKLGAMETKFNKLSVEVDGQEPDPAGQGEFFSVV